GDGTYRGWAVLLDSAPTAGVAQIASPSATALLRPQLQHLAPDPGSGAYGWNDWTADDATTDYQLRYDIRERWRAELVTLPAARGDGPSYLLPTTNAIVPGGPMLEFDPGKSRWQSMPTHFALSTYHTGDDGAEALGRA